MNEFQIAANRFLSRQTTAFYHVPYIGMRSPGNPDYLNDLKNTFNTFSPNRLQSASYELQAVLKEDLPKILCQLSYNVIVVCVVPRAKADNAYHRNQKLFNSTVQAVVQQLPGYVDGTMCLRRHTNTKTTHLRNPVPNYVNDGATPYPGITRATCDISGDVIGKDILLIDDIYTPGVNIDEDAIDALLNVGASTVTFYAVGKVMRG
jgi:hypothetical protein